MKKYNTLIIKYLLGIFALTFSFSVAAQQDNVTIQDKNKNVVRDYIEVVWNKKEYNRHGDFLVEEAILNGKSLGGVKGANEWIMYWQKIFPDQQKTFNLIIAEGDMVAVHFTEEGTQRAELFGIPASDQRLSWPVAAFFKMKNGKIVEITAVADHLNNYLMLKKD